MKMRMFYLLIICCYLLPIQTVFGQVTYKPKPLSGKPWRSDSLFVGAGCLVKDSSAPVRVTWRFSSPSTCKGKLCFMVPGIKDSAVFIFHNNPGNYSGEDSSSVIGKYSAGTEIFFRYEVDDTFSLCSSFNKKKIYSGQNRVGIDPYVSERDYPLRYGKRWVMGGRVDSSNIEIGFEDQQNFAFQGIIFNVENVCLEVIDKYKLSPPEPSITSQTFQNSISITLSVPLIGNQKIVNTDTTYPKINTAAIKIYYTLDNSDPRSSSTKILYNTPIPITLSTTLKAYALVESDTNWFPSEVLTQLYTKEESSVHQNLRPTSITSSTISDFAIYSINGQHIRTMTASASNALSYAQTLPSGVYFLRSKIGGQMRRVLVGRKLLVP